MATARKHDNPDDKLKEAILSAMKGEKDAVIFGLDYFLDVLPGMGPDDVKKLVNALVREGSLEFWSDAGTSRYAFKGQGKYRHKSG